MLGILVACFLFMVGFVPLMNSGHIVLAVLWMLLWLAGCVFVIVRKKK